MNFSLALREDRPYWAASRKGPHLPGAAYEWFELRFGALAQLGERYNGIVEVSGSIPLGSTIPAYIGPALGALTELPAG